MSDADKLLIATWAGAVANFLVAVVAVGIPTAQSFIQRRREALARLSATTMRHGDQLLLKIAYRPEMLHFGLQARITGVEPAHIIPTARNANPSNLVPDWDLSAWKGIGASQSVVIELVHFARDPDGVFFGFAIVSGIGDETALANAKVVVEISSTANNRRLCKKSLNVSPLNEDQNLFALSRQRV